MTNKFTDETRKRLLEAQIRGHETRRKQIQAKIDEYLKNPSCCLECRTILDYYKRKTKFCCRRCSATHSNRGRCKNPNGNNGSGKNKPLPPIKLLNCLVCGEDIQRRTGFKFCNRSCQAAWDWQQVKTRIQREQMIPCEYEHRSHVLRKYLFETRGQRCEICTLSEWMQQPIPLVIDHINGHSDDNRLINLRVICCNCDGQTPTYKGRNLGNGRAYRRQRYAEGKSW